MHPSLPLPDITINSDDYNRVWLLAERVSDQLPYVSAYLDRELRRAEICEPWEPAGVSMGQHVLFRVDEEPWVRLGKLSYPNWPVDRRGTISIVGPIGAALIGMKRDATIEWYEKERVRTLTVIDYHW